ncbi:MAG TPA: tRNA-dihydrouridine synthase, partial [Deinococcales bacterium]|nr:tRNA-dihydrouridine synthase [Deinococcales bacterium]
KVRLGWDSFTVVETAQGLEAAGASCLAVHGRTRQQAYTGLADWDRIAEVAASVNIPVIGSGDVTGPEDYARRRPLASGVMIARGAMGRPWIFSEVRGEPKPSTAQVVRGVWRHALLNAAWYGEVRGMKALRGQLGHYFKGFEGAAAIRNAATRVNTLGELRAVLRERFPAVAFEDQTVDEAFAGHHAA